MCNWGPLGIDVVFVPDLPKTVRKRKFYSPSLPPTVWLKAAPETLRAGIPDYPMQAWRANSQREVQVYREEL